MRKQFQRVSGTSIVKIRAFVVLVVLNSAFGNLLLSKGMRHMGDLSKLPPYRMLPAVLGALLDPWVAGGVALLAAFFFSYIALLSWADLSYVLPTTAASYLLVALLSHFILGERVSPLRWAGISLIVVGVSLVFQTQARTKP